jgi:nicotinate phosphoribosyltransferase
VFLIDTYDTLEGARCAARVGRRMQEEGRPLLGVRLDSGDMPALSRKVRKILDDAGLGEVKIFASSGLDEKTIAEILSEKGQIDAFGVGTKMGVSADAPYLDIVYKMVRYAERNVRKYSPGKRTLAGEKQVFRKIGKTGKWIKDIIGRRDERIPGTEPLLHKVMDQGKRVSSAPDLNRIRERVKANRDALPARYRSLYTRRTYPVVVSEGLAALQETAAP